MVLCLGVEKYRIGPNKVLQASFLRGTCNKWAEFKT
jgi:hypothetical protein